MIYEYKCKHCENVFELNRVVKERDWKAICPTCGGTGNRNLIPSQVEVNPQHGGRIPGICNSLPGDSFYCKNKRQFKDECKKHGLTPVGLD